MSVDRSLRMKSSLVRHRNVLSRPERVALLKATERWTDESSPLGMPKVANRRVKAVKKEKAAATEAAAPGATPAAGATASAPAAAADAKKADAAKKPAADTKKK
ncbi:MAG: small basic protein [Phycisphaerae bacterium]